MYDGGEGGVWLGAVVVVVVVVGNPVSWCAALRCHGWMDCGVCTEYSVRSTGTHLLFSETK